MPPAIVLSEPPLGADERVRFLYDYWSERRNGALLPPKSAINPPDLRKLLSVLVLYKVIDGGADYRFRLGGHLFEKYMGCSVGGRLLSEIAKPEELERCLAAGRAVIESRAPTFVRGNLLLVDRDFVDYERLFTPFHGDDPGEVGWILGVYAFIGR